MRTQLNRALAVLALTAGAASANPSAPVIQTTWNSPTNQATPTIQWTDATFDPLALNDRYYDLRIFNLTRRTETHVFVEVPASPTGAVGAQIPPLEPYSDYVFSVHANERDSLPCGLFPFPNCQYGPGPESAQTFPLTYHPDGPVVDTFVVSSAVNTPSVLALVKVHDYSSVAGGRVTGVEFTGASSFSCSAIAPAFSCFIPSPGGPDWDGNVQFPLSTGPDGPRTLMARFRDSARPVSNPCFACFDFSLPGNVSTTQTRTVLLDTRKPTISLVQNTSSTLTGVPVAFDAAGSKDGSGSAIDSGIPPSGYRWTFSDGGAANGPSVSRTYATPGTYGGTLTVSDRAGNVQTQTFSVTATKPIASSTAAGAPGAGAPPVAGSGGTSPGGATTAGKVRIGRLVRFGKYRAHRLGRVRVTSSTATTFVGALKQGKRTIQRIGVTGGPGRVTLGFIPPKAGRYVLSVTGAGVTQRVTITVRR